MTGLQPQTDEVSSTDDASWVYLSHSAEDGATKARLRDRVAEVCQASGWHALSWSLRERTGRGAEPGHFFEGIRHAVRHAAVFVAFIDDATELTDAELVLAYSYRRPIVSVCISGEDGSNVQAMLGNYERARMIASTDIDQCISDLRAIFADPEFAEVIHHAASEHATA